MPEFQIIEVLALVESTQEDPANDSMNRVAQVLMDDPATAACSVVLRDMTPHDGAVFADFLSKEAS